MGTFMESMALRTISDNRAKARSIASSIIGAADAEDAVQEAAIKMTEAVKKGACKLPCKSYFLKAVSNCAITAYRNKARKPEFTIFDHDDTGRTPLEVADTSTDSNPWEHFEAQSMHDLVARLCLSDRDAALLELLVTKASYKEIYAALGVGRSGIFRFRQKMARLLEQEGFLLDGYQHRNRKPVCA